MMVLLDKMRHFEVRVAEGHSNASTSGCRWKPQARKSKGPFAIIGKRGVEVRQEEEACDGADGNEQKGHDEE